MFFRQWEGPYFVYITGKRIKNKHIQIFPLSERINLTSTHFIRGLSEDIIRTQLSGKPKLSTTEEVYMASVISTVVYNKPRIRQLNRRRDIDLNAYAL